MTSSKTKIIIGISVVLLILACGVGLFAFDQIAEAREKDDDIILETGIGGENTIPVQGGITRYIELIYQFASGIVAGLAAIMIVIGGIQYATAAGNPKAIASAKETIISAIIGLVIVATGYLILGLFGTQFTNLSDSTLPSATYDKEPPEYSDCDSRSETNCAAGEGCVPYYSGGNFSHCGECPGSCRCSNYVKEDLCTQDPCNCGDCVPFFRGGSFSRCGDCPSSCNCSNYVEEDVCNADPCGCGSGGCQWQSGSCQNK